MATIVLGGKSRNLRFDIEALERAAEWTGQQWFDWELRNPKTLRCVLAAGLLRDDPKTTPDSIVPLLRGMNFMEVLRDVGAAVNDSFRVESAEGDAPGEAPAGGSAPA